MINGRKKTTRQMNDNRIPHYYIGSNGYEARKVVSGNSSFGI